MILLLPVDLLLFNSIMLIIVVNMIQWDVLSVKIIQDGSDLNDMQKISISIVLR